MNYKKIEIYIKKNQQKTIVLQTCGLIRVHHTVKQ